MLWREGSKGFCAPGLPRRWAVVGDGSPSPSQAPSPSPRASSEHFSTLFSLYRCVFLVEGLFFHPKEESHLNALKDTGTPRTSMCRLILVRPGPFPASLSRLAGIFPNFLVSFITSLPAVIGEGLGWMNWRSGGWGGLGSVSSPKMPLRALCDCGKFTDLFMGVCSHLESDKNHNAY